MPNTQFLTNKHELFANLYGYSATYAETLTVVKSSLQNRFLSEVIENTFYTEGLISMLYEKLRSAARRLPRPLAAFIMGFAVYPTLEIIWRGYTHYSMAFAGGICMVGIYFISSRLTGINLIVRCIIGAYFISAVEFIFGAVFNIWLGMNVWDYSGDAFNILGQVCLKNSLIWFLLCFPASALCASLDDRRLFARRA